MVSKMRVLFELNKVSQKKILTLFDFSGKNKSVNTLTNTTPNRASFLTLFPPSTY